jgi:hypothetical protein
MAQAGCGDEQTYSDVSVQDVVTGLNPQDDPDNEADQYLSESGNCEVYVIMTSAEEVDLYDERSHAENPDGSVGVTVGPHSDSVSDQDCVDELTTGLEQAFG